MKKLFIFILLLITSIHAQVFQEWVSRYNGATNNYDEATDIIVDNSGNVYVTGYTKVAALNEDYATIKYNSTGVALWMQTYNGPSTGTSYDDSYSIAVDLSGNVYITGYSRSTSNYDIATIKYNSLGVQQWVQRYNGPANADDGGTSIAVDATGNVYITGESRGSGSSQDYITIKYNTSGILLWEARYNGTGNGDDVAQSLVIDNSGNVYITGKSYGGSTNTDYATVKYDSNGIQQWFSRYNAGGPAVDNAHSIAIDNSGNVYVTGYSSGNDRDYLTIKYNSSGVLQWLQRYNGTGNGFDEAWGIAVDALGNVYVTGESVGNVGTNDYLTVKYNVTGIQQWVARYNGPANSIDIAHALALDSLGNIYVTGQSSGSSSNRDYTTLKYNSSGVQQWEARYNGPGNSVDHGKAITVGAFGNVYVTGLSRGSNNIEDYATLKYIQQPYSPTNLSALAISSSKINLNWNDNAGNETGFKIERSTNGGSTWNIISTLNPNVIAFTDSSLASNSLYHYRVFAYNQSGNSGYSNIAFDTTSWPVGIIANNNELPKEFNLSQNFPNPFNPVTNISFDLPKESFVKLVVYNSLGKEVLILANQDLKAGSYKVDWDASIYSSGVYFYKLDAGSYVETKKMILIK